jgi:membrane fusion protein, multidrug efflux system
VLSSLSIWARGARLGAIGAVALVSFVSAVEPVRAQLTPRRYALVAAEIGAKVSHVHVVEGGVFAAGDALLSFESALQRAQVERAQAVLVAAEKTFAANQRLFALKSVGLIEVDLSEAEVAKARAELAYAKAMLAKCEIRAPFAGRVAEQRVREQEFVQPGQALVEIIDDATPQVDFIAPSVWLAWLRTGDPLTVRIDETGCSYLATVERIGAKVDPVSQSVRVVAALGHDAAELMAGMSGTVSVNPTARP